MADLSNPRIVVIGGPTATGKTALSVALAKRFNGEIISADSMQIYKGLDVGTAKVTAEEMQGVPHWLVDFLPPDKTFSVADFTALADEKIRDITARGKLPFVVGGTGLYISSLIGGIRFAPDKTDHALRSRLQKELAEQGAEEMHRRLQQMDAEIAAAIHPNNTVRVLRALELCEATGKTMTEQKAQSRPETPPYRALCFALNDANRAELYRRTDLRVDKMLQNGLLKEAELVWHNRESYRTAAQAIGYKELFPYLEGTDTLEACTEKLKQATRNYAKRQLTWFKRMESIHWLDALDPCLQETAAGDIEQFLNQ